MAVPNPPCRSTPTNSSARCCRWSTPPSCPGNAFTDPAVLAWEQVNFFARGWICAGHVEQVSERGRFLKIETGGESVIVIGDEDGLPRAFLNTCRHRGAQLVTEPEGQLRRLQCPYHAWSYGFDGSLRNAPFTEGLTDFDPACFALHEVRLAVVEGLVLLDLSGEAPPPQDHIGDLARHMAAYRLPELRRAKQIVYEVGANWKAIAENYSECLHCPGVHPELNRLSHYLTGETYEGAGLWCGGSMTLAEGVETMSTDGATHARRAIAGVDERVILYFLIFPNTLVSLHPDYVMLHTLWPKRARPHGGRVRVVLRAGDDGRAGLRPDRRRRLLGPGQPRGLARLPAHAAGHELGPLHPRPVHDAGG